MRLYLLDVTMPFQLLSNSNPRAIRAALDHLAPLLNEGDAFWNWVEEKARYRKFAKGQAANTGTFGTTMDDGAIVLAPSNSRRMRSRSRSSMLRKLMASLRLRP